MVCGVLGAAGSGCIQIPTAAATAVVSSGSAYFQKLVFTSVAGSKVAVSRHRQTKLPWRSCMPDGHRSARTVAIVGLIVSGCAWLQLICGMPMQ
jgi:hypothetical protein